MPKLEPTTTRPSIRMRAVVASLACALAVTGFSACGGSDSTTTPGASGATGNVGPANAGSGSDTDSGSGAGGVSGGGGGGASSGG